MTTKHSRDGRLWANVAARRTERREGKCNTEVNQNDTKTGQSRWRNTHSCGMKRLLGRKPMLPIFEEWPAFARQLKHLNLKHHVQ